MWQLITREVAGFPDTERDAKLVIDCAIYYIHHARSTDDTRYILIEKLDIDDSRNHRNPGSIILHRKVERAGG